MTTSQGGGERNGTINSQLWHACAGPLVNLPPVGSLVVYFPQGHSEQVAASMQKKVDAHVPNYSNLPSKLICLLHNVTLHVDPETDDVYAQMTLQPVDKDKKEALLGSDHVLSSNRPQTEFFCKTLTASDTSTHGGFSVPRRAAEKIFPPLDFSMQPPVQELQARDLHNNLWTFRHIYRGQPKRHLLTTGWSHFVSGKLLSSGDSVLFIKDEKSELLVGIRRSNNQTNNISSSVLSSDSMHIGILAAAAHAAANNSPFTVFYNPRASPAEFVIPLAKYNAAIYNNNLSLGMRFRMVFETEESGTRRYMGTITGIDDLDPVRWKNSQWRNLQVGWDESGVGEKCNRVSLWDIEPVVAPFFIYPPPFFGAKHPRQPGIIDESSGMENLLKRIRPWLGEEILKDSQFQNTMMPGLNQLHFMNMQQNRFLNNANMQSNHLHSLAGPVLQSISMADLPKHLNSVHIPTQDNMQPIMQNSLRKTQQMNQIPNLSAPPNQFGRKTLLNQQQPQDFNLASTDAYSSSQFHNPLVQTQIPMPNHHQQTSYSQNLQCLQNANLLDQLQRSAQHQQFLKQQQASMPVGTHVPSDQCPQNLSEEVHAEMLQKLQQHSLPLQPTKQQCQPVKDKQNSVLGDLPGHVDTCTFTKHGPESQHIVPNSSIAVQCPQLKIPAQQMEQTNDVFSSSTTTNNHGLVLPQTVINRTFSGQAMTNKTSSAMPNPKPDIFEALATRRSIDTYLQRDYNEVDLTPSASKKLDSYACLHAAPQMDVLNPSSLVTPACLSGADGELNQIFPMPSHQPSMFGNDSLGIQHQADNPGKNDLSPVNFGNTAGALPPTETLLTKTINTGNSNSISSEEVVINYNSKEAQHDLSSYVSQSFGVPDVAFNSLDDNIKDSNLYKNSFASPPQLQRKRTYTKVYKRGAVGRSIDVTRCSGYTELNLELARMFSLGGRLEDLQRLGWKLVYVDQENDVLLVGDDPWEEFVSCVRCIRILSPREVKQMSLDADVGSKMPPTNQTCSSDGGHVWQDHIGQDHINPCELPFGNFG